MLVLKEDLSTFSAFNVNKHPIKLVIKSLFLQVLKDLHDTLPSYTPTICLLKIVTCFVTCVESFKQQLYLNPIRIQNEHTTCLSTNKSAHLIPFNALYSALVLLFHLRYFHIRKIIFHQNFC